MSAGGLALISVLLINCAARGPSAPAARHEVNGVWVEIKRGETLRSLAQRHGAPLEDLEELNGVDRGDRLAVGTRIFVPGRRQGRQQGPAKPRPTTPSVAPKPSAGFAWPVPGGKISSRFGKRGGRMHEGLDIAATEGSPILAAAAGRVLYAGAGIRGYGNLVMLRHVGDLVTVYAHNKRNHVREGQRVRRGEVIAEVGRTGRATGYHVHFEVRRREVPMDPLPYLRRE